MLRGRGEDLSKEPALSKALHKIHKWQKIPWVCCDFIHWIMTLKFENGDFSGLVDIGDFPGLGG